MRKLTLFILLICTVSAMGQSLPRAQKRQVSTTSYMVSASKYDYTTAARDITQGCRSDYDRAKAIYLWLCENISFDPTLKIRTADECWQQRKAVCQGYCELFYRMAETLGIKTDLIYGQVKIGRDMPTTEKHVWLLVRSERGSHLLDPTWGAGKLINGKFERNSNPLLWFDVHPSWLIFTHLPQRQQYQFTRISISEADFSSLPFATPALAQIGWKADDALAEATSGHLAFPHLHPQIPANISFHSVPAHRILSPARKYRFTIKGLAANESLCIQDASGKAIDCPVHSKGNTHTLTITPNVRGKLTLCLSRSNGFFAKLQPLMEYEVK